MLGIMVFSVIVWATTAISYPVSAGVIIALMAVLIGFAPNPATGKIFGTATGLGMGLKGFSTTAFCLVAAAMFLATAMTKTGLDKRIALVSCLSWALKPTVLLSALSAAALSSASLYQAPQPASPALYLLFSV